MIFPSITVQIRQSAGRTLILILYFKFSFQLKVIFLVVLYLELLQEFVKVLSLTHLQLDKFVQTFVDGLTVYVTFLS